ncbi:lipopolysaccharide biosynthesis protein [Roseibacillus ishigakijimensis]|uniref:Membrane protein involved in the export of O-antigen and teichoic acid n=1 Tax=Roseibacillus ishigakijimensis TaxID=454146 RepID=A0A934RQK8_9BACT|nr:hypothetical protein [Roseibacillus ishigakijimensis]MBK1833638.1 hypothetical protein [Roseibacillus ishigakijimensis]
MRKIRLITDRNFTFLAVALGKLILAIRQFLTVPLLISAWGAEKYGEWLVISAIPTFIQLSNVGIGTSAATSIAIRSTKEDEKNAVTFTTSVFSILIVFTAVILLVLIVCPFFQSKEDDSSENIVIICCLLFAAFVRILTQPIQGWWNSKRKAYIGIILTQIFFIGEIGLYLFVWQNQTTSVDLAIYIFLWSIIWLFSYCSLLKKQKFKLFNVKSFRLKEVRALVGIGAGYQLSSVWQAVFFQGSILMANGLYGPIGASMWGSLRIFIRAGHQAIELISQTINPEIQVMTSNGQNAKVKRLVLRSAYLAFAVSLVMSLMFIFGGHQLFIYWTGGKFYLDKVTWNVFVLSLVPFSIWWVIAEFQRSIGKPWFVNVTASICSIIFLVSSAAFEFWLFDGLISLCYGVLLFEILMTITIVSSTRKLFRGMV